MRSGLAGLNSCRVNFLEAITPFGLGEDDLRDNIVLFKKSFLDPNDGKIYEARSNSDKDDYIEFYAEMDLLVAVSVCPCGDNTRDWSSKDHSLAPVGIEIYETNISPQPFPKWTEWRTAWKGKWTPPATEPAKAESRELPAAPAPGIDKVMREPGWEKINVTQLRDPSRQQPRYQLDKQFYESLRAAKTKFKLLDRSSVLPLSGGGFIVKKGQTFRLIELEGPQIADVGVWNLHNPKETVSSLRTWELEGWFLKVNSRVWSGIPWFRPLITCIDETLDSRRRNDDFHHHSVASQCSAEQVEMRSGRAGANACRLNMLQAIEPFGWKEEHIRDNLDFFQKWLFNPKENKFYGARTDAKHGDYIEFYAEIDVVVAVSVCPAGDNSKNESPEVHPLGFEIYDTGIPPKEFPSWTDWRIATASGNQNS
jgi:uncharacterized protein